MSDESEPVMAQVWERLEKYDRELLAKAMGIPEAQLALTRCSSVVLKLLGALGHTTAAELEKKKIEQLQIAAESEKIKAALAASAQNSIENRYPHFSDYDKKMIKSLQVGIEIQMQTGNVAGAAKLNEQLQRIIHAASLRNASAPAQYGIAGQYVKKR